MVEEVALATVSRPPSHPDGPGWWTGAGVSTRPRLTARATRRPTTVEEVALATVSRPPSHPDGPGWWTGAGVSIRPRLAARATRRPEAASRRPEAASRRPESATRRPEAVSSWAPVGFSYRRGVRGASRETTAC